MGLKLQWKKAQQCISFRSQLHLSQENVAHLLSCPRSLDPPPLNVSIRRVRLRACLMMQGKLSRNNQVRLRADAAVQWNHVYMLTCFNISAWCFCCFRFACASIGWVWRCAARMWTRNSRLFHYCLCSKDRYSSLGASLLLLRRFAQYQRC